MFVVKDPDAILDYGLDWKKWLVPGDSIVGSSWSVVGPDSDLTTSDPSFESPITAVWLTGGTLGYEYDVVNHITTADGREDDRTIKVRIEQR